MAAARSRSEAASSTPETAVIVASARSRSPPVSSASKRCRSSPSARWAAARLASRSCAASIRSRSPSNKTTNEGVQGIAAARGVPLGCLAQVLRAFGEKPDAPGSRRAAAAVPGLVEQLTARELEILVLLAAGTPNPRIAEQLVVSLDTVKKHVSHVLGKLGAANRTEAVTRARQLGLIP